MALKPPSVYVRDTGTPKGRGVFASRAFGVGEVVEECPVVLLRKPYDVLHKELKTIVFHWQVPEGSAATQALALGYGSLYNHSNPSNLRYETDREALLMRFVAVRDIRPDEELTINYNADGGAAVSVDDWWFDEKGIKLVSGEV
ncbi:MAG TPA: SET domain-containing protein [Pyrinomonadaceae bacterium]|jgi:SET domain-containing protein